MDLTENEIALELCRRLNIPTNGKTSGNVVVKCFSPYHPDKKPSCSVSLDKSMFHCFSCGYSGSLKTIYKQKYGVSIYKDLGVNRSFSLLQQQEEVIDFSILPDVDFKFTGQLYPLNSTDLSKKWVEKRGFNLEVLDNLNIKYCKFGRTIKESDPADKEEWRSYSDMAFIPIYENKKLLCFEARQLRSEDEWFKHLESKNIDVSKKEYKKILYPKNSSTKTLYRFDYLNRDEPLYLVEGLMDVLSLRTNKLFENSTTTFGRGIKERQFYLLSKFKKIIYIPNLDMPGILAIEQFKKKDMKNVYILCLPKNSGIKDVNDILQGKHKRFKTLENLVNAGWLNKIQHIDDFDIESNIKSIS